MRFKNYIFLFTTTFFVVNLFSQHVYSAGIKSNSHIVDSTPGTIPCECMANSKNLNNIDRFRSEYKSYAKDQFFYDLNYLEKEWQKKYSNQLERLYLNAPSEKSLLYSDVYHHIQLFSQRLDIIKNEKIESYEVDRKGTKSWIEWCDKQIARAHEKHGLCKQKVNECCYKITNEYAVLFEKCLNNHFNDLSYKEYSLLAFLNNNFQRSVELLIKLVNHAEENQEQHKLEAKVYHNLGSACFEVMIYDKAIHYLTEAISRDPSNMRAYFDRALAYFETGNFDLAIEDYVISKNFIPSSNPSLPEVSADFTSALLTSLKQGASEAVIDFVPSLCSSAYGLGEALWTTVDNPVETSISFAKSCYEAGECVVDYCKNLDWNTVDGYVDQMKILCDQYKQLSPAQKGELIGYMIGRYGIDVLVCNATLKGIAAFNHLKNANRVCNLEALIASEQSKLKITTAARQHFLERDLFFKNVKIHWDHQNKHIVGKHNYEKGRGIFEHSDAQGLLSKFAGKGKPVNDHIPSPGYKERVDFEEFIGYYVSETNPGLKLPTTKGIIHYRKNGAHIIPCYPEGY